MINLAKKILIVVLVLIMLIVVSSIILVMYFFTNGDFNIPGAQTTDTGEKKVLTQGNEDIDKIVVNVDADIGNIDIILGSKGTGVIFDADWTHKYITDSELDEISTITITNSSTNGVLTMNIIIEQSEIGIYFMEEWDVDIILSPDLSGYSIDILLTTGDSKIDASEITLNKLEVGGTTGDINVDLTECTINSDIVLTMTTGDIDLYLQECIITGNIQLIQTTGDGIINFKDLVFNQDTQITMSSTTGKLSMTWDQDIALTHDIDFNTDRTTGDTLITINSLASLTRFKGTGSTTTGDVNINGEEQYESSNYTDTTKDLIDIVAATTTGDIEITYNLA